MEPGLVPGAGVLAGGGAVVSGARYCAASLGLQ